MNNQNEIQVIFDQLIKLLEQKQWQNFQQQIFQVVPKYPQLTVMVVQQQQQNLLFKCMSIEQDDILQPCFQFLLQHGANPNLIDYFDQTVLFYIAKCGKVNLFEQIKHKNIEINHKDRLGQTAIFYAARHAQNSMLIKLIDNGANIQIIDNFNQTPIFYAAISKDIASCQILHDFGANVDHLDKEGRSPLYYAQQYQCQEVIDFFLQFSTNKIRKKRAQVQRNAQNLRDSDESSVEQVKKIYKKKSSRAQQKPKSIYRLAFSQKDLKFRELSERQILEFKQKYPNICDLILNTNRIPSHPNYVEIRNMKTWQTKAQQLLQDLWSKEGANIFHEPVDPVRDMVPNYFQVIENPMDFGTVKQKLKQNVYENFREFQSDINLVFDNCILFNTLQNPFGVNALQLKEYFAEKINELKLNLPENQISVDFEKLLQNDDLQIENSSFNLNLPQRTQSVNIIQQQTPIQIQKQHSSQQIVQKPITINDKNNVQQSTQNQQQNMQQTDPIQTTQNKEQQVADQNQEQTVQINIKNEQQEKNNLQQNQTNFEQTSIQEFQKPTD